MENYNFFNVQIHENYNKLIELLRHTSNILFENVALILGFKEK